MLRLTMLLSLLSLNNNAQDSNFCGAGADNCWGVCCCMPWYDLIQCRTGPPAENVKPLDTPQFYVEIDFG